LFVKCHLKLHIDITLHYITLFWLTSGNVQNCEEAASAVQLCS